MRPPKIFRSYASVSFHVQFLSQGPGATVHIPQVINSDISANKNRVMDMPFVFVWRFYSKN